MSQPYECSECGENHEFLISIPSRYPAQEVEYLCEECFEHEVEPYEEWPEEF